MGPKPNPTPQLSGRVGRLAVLRACLAGNALADPNPSPSPSRSYSPSPSPNPNSKVLLAKKIDLDTNELFAELSAPLRGEARAYLYNPEPIALILTLTLTPTNPNPN